MHAVGTIVVLTSLNLGPIHVRTNITTLSLPANIANKFLNLPVATENG